MLDQNRFHRGLHLHAQADIQCEHCTLKKSSVAMEMEVPLFGRDLGRTFLGTRRDVAWRARLPGHVRSRNFHVEVEMEFEESDSTPQCRELSLRVMLL